MVNGLLELVQKAVMEGVPAASCFEYQFILAEALNQRFFTCCWFDFKNAFDIVGIPHHGGSDHVFICCG